MEKQSVIGALAALAQETRLDVFRLLVQAGPDGLAAGTVSERLGLAPATLSFHLKELKGAGLVRVSREGRSRIYSPDFEVVRALIGFMTESCCRGLDDTGRGCEPDACAPSDPDHP